MRIFDTNVQEIKYNTLTEVIRSAYEGNLQSAALDIPKKLAPGPKPELRCCIYKERAILGERVKLAMGGDRDNPNVVEVIREACDECPVSGILVTDACRGCLFHRCADECPKGAITIVNHRAVIDKEKCIEWKVHSGVSLQRAHTSASPVYAQLQGQRHFHGCRQKGGD